jgi:hypothetical protein
MPFAGCGHFPHRHDPPGFVRALEVFLHAPAAVTPRSLGESALPRSCAA